MTSRWPPLLDGRASAVAADASPLDPRVVPVSPVAIGEVVAGKYRIDGVIGFGGMGIVCAATHLELHTSIAIKFVRPERGVDDRAVTRFLTEARAAAQLRSQHACRVMDCGRLDTGVPYIVMEQLVGSDLRGLMDRSGALPLADAVTYALQACEALAEAHSKHIVHRDVKPENLFLAEGPSGAPCLKVLDFGISKQLGPLGPGRSITEPTENMGSPLYMSPEQMIDPGGVDSRTDIWSLGVVLYELLTGQPPFSGETTPQLCASVMTTQPLPPREHRAEISEALSGVILRCMEKDRERRFRDVGQLAAALRLVELHSHGEGELEQVEDAEVVAIAGVPARGLGLRVSVVLVLLAAGGLAAYALRRAVAPEAPDPAAAPSTSSGPQAAPPPSPVAEPEPAASVSAAPKTPKRAPLKSPAPTKPPSAPSASEAPNLPPPAFSSEIVYPEVKPPPELPPPETFP
jgi:eukaryotic-like serine/threonine-protein kinase